LLLDRKTLSLILPAYAFIAAALPVWVLMVPRDYLSSYMKIGVIVVLGVGIVVAAPMLKMPAITPFVSGGGPVVSGAVWPFVCIVIMCGALSGFHALIASGTTPKMINKESDIRSVGYGAMVLEGFVAVTALVAACALEPGDYFIINADQKNAKLHAAYIHMTETPAAELGFDPAPKQLAMLEAETKETLANRASGAVTLAVGMTKVFTDLPGMKTLAAYWYHFVIMFEALFILTLLETGTRVTRFIFQEALLQIRGPTLATDGAQVASGKPDWLLNIALSFATCFMWGYLLYTGSLDTLWRMLGIANQLLATIALAVGTTYLLNSAPKRRYALLTGIPFVFTIVTVMVAGWQSIQGWWAAGISADTPTAAAFQFKLMCVLAGSMLFLTGIIAIDAMRRWVQILRGPADTAGEVALMGK
jgi:carbon starvation protein